MKSFSVISSLLALYVLLFQTVGSTRNLFLPRTGDINLSQVIAENLANVTNFESLLGAGRSSSYPYGTAFLLAIATIASENNWKVSSTGFDKVLGIPQEEIVASYGALLEMLEKDDNVTLSNILFALHPNFSPSEALTDTLMTEVREASWQKHTWKRTYDAMVEHLGNVTNEKIDKLLIPSVTQIGTPFGRNTEAVILSTFHYINTWQYPWTDAEIGKFQDNDGIPYLKVEGKFLVANESEFIAVAVPLEGGSKNLVFVLPHANLTGKYFRTRDDDEVEEEPDIVPFPKKWELKTLRLKVPAFNTTDVDQYGQELEQAGMNETFCTIFRDPTGKFPYYVRPMVQVNFLDFNEDFLELASATGVAVERFFSLFGLFTQPPPGKEKDDDKLQGSGSKSVPPSKTAEGQDKEQNKNSPVHLNSEETLASDIPTIAFDRAFLWYLNDTDVGPMYFGTVETLINLSIPDNSTEQPGGEEDSPTTMLPDVSSGTNGTAGQDNSEILSEIDKFFLWSCRSFVPASAAVEGELMLPISSFDSNDTSTAFDSGNLTSSVKESEKNNESVISTASPTPSVVSS